MRVESTSRRVRVLFDDQYIVDTTAAKHVWEHKYYPQYYVPIATIVSGVLEKGKAVDSDGCAFLGTVKGLTKSTDRVLIFEEGPLAGLVRLEFGAMGQPSIHIILAFLFHCAFFKFLDPYTYFSALPDAWFEEDMEIYIHPKDPYVRVEILPSSRHIKVVLDGVTIAESSNNMFLFETNLRTRYYMPKTSVR